MKVTLLIKRNLINDRKFEHAKDVFKICPGFVMNVLQECFDYVKNVSMLCQECVQNKSQIDFYVKNVLIIGYITCILEISKITAIFY